jgi:hypothetical protein
VTKDKKLHWWAWPLIPVAWVCAPFVRLFVWIIFNADKPADECRHRHLEHPLDKYTLCLDCGALVVGAGRDGAGNLIGRDDHAS